MKKRKMSKIIGFLLVFSMLISTCDITVLAKSKDNILETTKNSIIENDLQKSSSSKRKGLLANKKNKNNEEIIQASDAFSKKSSIKKESAVFDDFTYLISGNNVVITGYEGDGGNITIPDRIENSSVTEIKASAFSGKTGITEVTLPSSLTTIGNYAFKIGRASCRERVCLSV